MPQSEGFYIIKGDVFYPKLEVVTNLLNQHLSAVVPNAGGPSS